MKFQEITQSVNIFREGSQFQTIKSYRGSSNHWTLWFDFFPAPRGLCLHVGEGGVIGFTEDFKIKGWIPSPCPLQLYLKAHLINRHLLKVSQRESALVLEFAPQGARLELKSSGEDLEATIQVPGRKDYRQRLHLGRAVAEKLDEPLELPVPATVNHKKLRLVGNIESDIQEASRWLERFEGICAKLESHPSSWADLSEAHWTSAEIDILQSEIREGKLPRSSSESIGLAQKKLFQARRRARRKVEGGQRRLLEVLARNSQEAPKKRDAPSGRAEPSTGLETESPRAFSVPKKKPGLWVELEPGLWARVGRNSIENGELFRQSRDRDLWFHVRGSPGGHVWIPRGQAGFGSKSEVSEKLIEWGTQLALINSKLKNVERVDVDYTERRNLKAIKGAGPGHLQILTSQTRVTVRDEVFERKVRGR